jgi:hypothetical protein
MHPAAVKHEAEEGWMADLLEPAAIFVVSCLASLLAWELDHEVFSGLFAVAAGVAFTMTPSD